MISFDLDKRVKIADGREGFVLSGLYKGRETLCIRIMTDDYTVVSCLEPQLKIIKRTGDTVVFGQQKHNVYPGEAKNHKRLRSAIKGAGDMPVEIDIRETNILMPRQLALAI